MLSTQNLTLSELALFDQACQNLISAMQDDSIIPGVSAESILGGAYPTRAVREALETLNLGIGGNGAVFDNSVEGFLPALVASMYGDRKATKKKMIEAEKQYQATHDQKFDDEKKRLDLIQQALKVTLNSAYGTISNQYFRWFDVRQSEAVTITGRLAIQWVVKHINEFLNTRFDTKDKDYVIASDTDSMYIRFAEMVDNTKPVKEIIAEIDGLITTELQPYLNKTFEDMRRVINARQQKMVMKRELIASTGIWTGKKYYALAIWDKEGVRYRSPNIKITGLQAIRNTTPQQVRKWLKRAVRIILLKDERKLRKYIRLCRERYNQLPVEDISGSMSAQNITKYRTDKGWAPKTPIHIKAAIIHNQLLDDLKLGDKYHKLDDGDKVKFCYLKEPNLTGAQVVGFGALLPPEFGLHEMVDRTLQFNKTFVTPLKKICDEIGWQTQRSMGVLDMIKAFEAHISGQTYKAEANERISDSDDDGEVAEDDFHSSYENDMGDEQEV